MTSIPETVQEYLTQIEAKEQVTIFYACESGSRAWGFPSPDSDYDIRFLYMHPVEWYLSIDEKRDVIEHPLTPENLDFSGWDIRKALRLFRKSNPPLFEWLGSPIIYREKTDLAARLRTLVQTYYSPLSCIHHYLHMAQGNFRDYLQGEQVLTKKYFYVLRPILVINWIEHGYGVAPTALGPLVERLIREPALLEAIQALIVRKSQGEELDKGPRLPVLSEFIEKELARLEQGFNAAPNQPPVDEMDKLFRYALEACA
jgi:predicted nucleotidyltransferase